jgi:glyoxylase-like metal-dependent hydrolase (beta-lactamase superfamily II)
MLAAHGEIKRRYFQRELPELDEVVITPPNRTLDTAATVDLGGRMIGLRHLGLGHTDNDIVVVVPDAGVLFAGDLLENDATPYFGDAYPLDWPATAERLVELADGVVVPGHGTLADQAFAVRQMTEFRAVAELARLVHGGVLAMDEAVLRTPYTADTATEPLARALAQLRGELGP